MKGRIFSICFICLVLMIVSTLPVSGQDARPTEKIASESANPAPHGQTGPEQEMHDIYDIKPPTLFGVNPAWIKYSLIILGVVLFLMVLFSAYRYWKKRRYPIESVTAQLSPEDRANAFLKDLEKLMAINGKEFYFKLSAVFRGYIQDRYGIDALEMTSEELIPNIKRLAVDEKLKADSRSFITSSDPVKFTDMAVDPGFMESHYRFVRTFVEKTTPVPTVTAQANDDKSDGS